MQPCFIYLMVVLTFSNVLFCAFIICFVYFLIKHHVNHFDLSCWKCARHRKSPCFSLLLLPSPSLWGNKSASGRTRSVSRKRTALTAYTCTSGEFTILFFEDFWHFLSEKNSCKILANFSVFLLINLSLFSCKFLLLQCKKISLNIDNLSLLSRTFSWLFFFFFCLQWP